MYTSICLGFHLKMETTIYQSIKLQILAFFNLTKDAVHIHIGMGVFLFAAVIWTKGRIRTKCLIPVFIIALLMEMMDLRDDLYSLGHFRWSASIHDFVNTIFWPAILVILGWFGQIRHD